MKKCYFNKKTLIYFVDIHSFTNGFITKLFFFGFLSNSRNLFSHKLKIIFPKYQDARIEFIKSSLKSGKFLVLSFNNPSHRLSSDSVSHVISTSKHSSLGNLSPNSQSLFFSKKSSYSSILMVIF